MQFNSALEIYDYLIDSGDLYNTTKGIYLFNYNAAGAIAYYYISRGELRDLLMKVDPEENYLGAALGPGGYIIDVQLIAPDGEIIEYEDPEFEYYYNDPGYKLDCSDILDFLEPLVADDWRIL